MTVEEIIEQQNRFFEYCGLIGLSDEMRESLSIAVDFYQNSIKSKNTEDDIKEVENCNDN